MAIGQSTGALRCMFDLGWVDARPTLSPGQAIRPPYASRAGDPPALRE